MSCHYYKLAKVWNEVAQDIIAIGALETQAKLIEEFDEAKKPIYRFLETLQKEKEQNKPETHVYLPNVVIKAKLEASSPVVQESRDYANTLTSLPNDYRDMIHDFIHLYASSMLSSFMIIDGKCLTTDVTHANVIFGKFKFKNISVVMENTSTHTSQP